MSRTIGIDAGGTSIRTAIVERSTGSVVSEEQFAGRNLLINPDTVDVLAGIISRSGADRCGLSLAGAGNPKNADNVRQILEERCGVHTVVVGDFLAAHHACFRGGDGVVVVSGTGSVAFGRTSQGHTLVGGHGPVLGDEGSAWWIGREAVTAALRAVDGRGPDTALVALLDRASPSGLRKLCRLGTELTVDRRHLAELAPTVDEAAAADSAAADIMSRAAGHLVELAQAALGKLGDVPVGYTGGVFHSRLVASRFAASFPDAVEGMPAVRSAVQLADLEQAGAWALGLGPGA